MTKITLSCPDPKDSAAFYRRVFGVKSIDKLRPEDHAVYEMGEVQIVLRKELSSEERRLVGIGSVKRHRGWGLTLTITIPDYKPCLKRVRRIPGALLAEDPEAERMVIQDPAGYVLEVTGGS